MHAVAFSLEFELGTFWYIDISSICNQYCWGHAILKIMNVPILLYVMKLVIPL